jgi:hypothetical protein
LLFASVRYSKGYAGLLNYLGTQVPSTAASGLAVLFNTICNAYGIPPIVRLVECLNPIATGKEIATTHFSLNPGD